MNPVPLPKRGTGARHPWRVPCPARRGLRPLAPLFPISFSVSGKPKAWQRARTGKDGGFYTDAETRAFKNHVATLAKLVMRGAEPFSEALEMHVIARLPIPPSWSKVRQDAARRGALRPTGKPDADNLYKGVADALNEILYRDDAQVVKAVIEKVYSDDPCVVITVRRVWAEVGA